ncbi:MAG: heterodisulfide reductase-related iron-sulfur binding cluster [Candidatus Binatia bacterium]
MAEAIGLKVDDPKFWDAGHLKQEVDRIFDICWGCRLCFKFCGSFPTLFELIDRKTDQLRAEHLSHHPEIAAAAAERRRAAAENPAPVEEHHGGEVGVTYGDELPEIQAHARDLTNAEVDRVVELCFQCKLCYPNCPYTPPHEFALDFPRLLLRWKAHQTRHHGVSLQARLMRDTETIGRAASTAPELANWALKNRPNRAVMESVVGIHRDKLLPTYHRETFPQWWKAHQPRIEPAEPLKEGVETPTPVKAALFSTCLIDYNDPQVGAAAVCVLEHNGVEVVRPEGQVCCGMPFLDGGDLDAAAAKIRRNVEILAPYAEQGYAIVIPSPSCSLMMREDFPQLVAGPRTDVVARRSHDLNEYLYRLARDGRLKRDFRRRFGRVQYHVPCHIRVQNIGIRGRDLLRLVADEVELVQECSGHDGTWSMQKAHFEESLRWGQKAFAGMRAGAGEPCALACTDCRLAALHLEQGAGRKTVHPVVALAAAYGFEVGQQLDTKPV